MLLKPLLIVGTDPLLPIIHIVIIVLFVCLVIIKRISPIGVFILWTVLMSFYFYLHVNILSLLLGGSGQISLIL